VNASLEGVTPNLLRQSFGPSDFPDMAAITIHLNCHFRLYFQCTGLLRSMHNQLTTPQDIKPQTFWGHDPDRLGSHDHKTPQWAYFVR